MYRIASTIHFLIFFFITLIVFDFSLPDRLILLIAVLNDAATLVISVDHAKISTKPDKWRLGRLLTLSFALGFLLMGTSFAVYFIARDVFHVTQPELQTIMYLQISSCPHFVIFSTRTESWFWKSLPSLPFLLAILGTQVFAMFMSIYGVTFFEAVAIGWPWGLAIIASSLIAFVFLDVVKVTFFKYWSFELTVYLWPTKARRRELQRRREEAAKDMRLNASIDKVRKAMHAMYFIRVLQDSAAKKEGAKQVALQKQFVYLE